MSYQGLNPHLASPSDSGRAASWDIADVLAVLRARLGLILRVTVVVIAAGVVVATLLPTRYESSAVVVLDQRKNTVADLTSVLSALPTDPTSLQNQIQILYSRNLAAEVIAKLKLYDDPEFNPWLQPSVGHALLVSLDPRHWGDAGAALVPPDAAVQRDAIIDAFLTHLSAESLGLSTTITVSFASRDPRKSALIADTIASTYVADQITSKLAASEATGLWLTQRIQDLSKQVQEQEAAALTYKAQNNLDSSPGGTALVEAQLSGINAQLVQARADLAAKISIYTQVENLVKAGNGANVSQVVASPLIIQLRGQQAELMRQQADLTVRYGPRNPKRIAVETQLADLNQKIAEEVTRIAAALANDVSVARAQVGSLQASLIMTQHQASGQDMTAVKLQALEANARSTRNLYDSYLARLHAIQDQDGLQYPEARVISRAPVNGVPASPPRLLIVLASIPAGLLLGMLAALLAERWGGRRPVPRPLGERRPVSPGLPAPVYAGPPLLAEIPGTLATGAADHVIDWPAAPFSRAIDGLLRRVVGPSKSGSGRIVCVTSSDPGQAGTTISLALARAAAQSGLRTILVDGSLTQPAIARAIGVQMQAGIVDVLRGTAPLNHAFVRDPLSSVLLLSVLQPALDPAAVLGAPRTAELFTHLRGLADLIIMGAPPVLAARETPFLTRLSDIVVVVADPAAGPRSLLGRALSALTQWRSPPVGMVLAR